LNMGRMLLKRLTLSVIGLRGRPVDGPHGKAAIVADVREKVWPMIESGQVRTIVHDRVPLAEASRAHAMLEAGGVRGKILLVR
jgi:NADPH:quinone reductase-like Zn-dependent oxidoreductase